MGGVWLVLLGFCVYVCIHFVSVLCAVCVVFVNRFAGGVHRAFVEVVVFCLSGLVRLCSRYRSERT